MGGLIAKSDLFKTTLGWILQEEKNTEKKNKFGFPTMVWEPHVSSATLVMCKLMAAVRCCVRVSMLT